MMKKIITAFLFPLVLLVTSCDNTVAIKPDEPTDETKHETITLGGGCYWCVEAVFQQLEGVVSATSGFMGGHVPDPTYEDVTGGFSGHIEVVQVVYDPAIISTKEIITWFWKAHDPTDALGQGVDKGPMYMSNIFFHSEEQGKIAEASKSETQAAFDAPIVTTIREAEEFYKAPEKHQDFYAENGTGNPYCRAQITPKLKKLKLKH